MKVLIDTNIYLELFLGREKKELVKKLFYLAYINNNQTFVTTQTLRDIEYILRHYVHDSKTSKMLQHKAYEITSKVISVSNDAAIEALFSDIKDYEDALQSLASEEYLLDAIVTLNKKDYINSKIPAFTPTEICNLWEKNK